MSDTNSEFLTAATDEERENLLSHASHDLRNVASTIRAEAQLAQMKYERAGNVERMYEALTSIISQTDLLVQILESKVDRCRRRRKS